MLHAELWIWIPARIKEHEQWLDVVSGRNFKKLIDAALETHWVCLPMQVMQEHAHGVHPHVFSPAQLFVAWLRVERLGLPHLKFIDCVGRNVVAADQPRLLVVPTFGLLFRPTLRLRNEEV